MNKIFTVFFVCLFLIGDLQSQNVGIGTTSPTGPLSFANVLGNKVVLYGNGTLPHYGFGIQSNTLQVYTDAASSNISFGFGNSAIYNERMLLFNGGGDGLSVNGRLTLKNGTNPLDVNYGAGVWMYKADNTALLGFMGVQNNQNLGFYGGPAGWGFTYDAINSRVGIGTNVPVNRLDVAGLNNWDLNATEGDMRIGTSSYRIKFGVATAGGGAGASTIMQYGQAGGFNNLALGSQGKNYINLNGTSNYVDITNTTGGLRIDGNAGTAGQVLTSNGPGAAPSWNSGTTIMAANSLVWGQNAIVSNFTGFTVVPGLTQVVNVPSAGRGMFIVKGQMVNNGCFACGLASCKYDIWVDGVLIDRAIIQVGNGLESVVTNGAVFYDLAPGSHTFQVYVDGNGNNFTAYGFRLVYMLLPK
jgi:hypothetical protein